MWRIPVPTGIRFRGGSFYADVGAPDPRLSRWYIYRPEGETQPTVPAQIESSGWYSWGLTDTSAADRLVFQIGCPSDKCVIDSTRTPGDAYLDVRYLTFQIEDLAGPSIGTLSGALTEGAAQRGTQGLAVAASDAGSGVADVTVTVNGERFATKDAGCAVAPDGRALRLSPCPASPTVGLPVDTTQPPFVEGANDVEVCVNDYAEETEQSSSWAGESCTSTTEYVDNSCDVSASRDAADVHFALAKRTVRFGDRARAVAKLTDADGKPIGGATVCVSEQDRVGGARELDIGKLETNGHGRASMKLSRGASRRVKLTYWRDGENVEIEAARLNVRARPKLLVLSKHRLSDGRRVRFRVRLPGPYRAARKVAVQALAPAGWLDFPGCTGKTDDRGVFECSYRFREQAGSLTYKFRALAPRQAGYPYLRGRTGAKKIVVRD